MCFLPPSNSIHLLTTVLIFSLHTDSRCSICFSINRRADLRREKDRDRERRRRDRESNSRPASSSSRRSRQESEPTPREFGDDQAIMMSDWGFANSDSIAYRPGPENTPPERVPSRQGGRRRSGNEEQSQRPSTGGRSRGGRPPVHG